MSLQRSVHFSRELVLIFCPLEPIYIEEKWTFILGVKFVVNTLRLQATCCGSVLWQAMCGCCLRAASKNAKIMLKISSFCLKYWLGSWRKRTSLKHGQWSHGQFGMLLFWANSSSLKKKIHDSAMGFLEEYQRHMATQRHWKGCVAILFYKWPSDLLFFSYCNVLHVLALGVSLVFFILQCFACSIIVLFEKVVILKSAVWNWAFLESRVFGKNYQKVLLKKAKCLANTYKSDSLMQVMDTIFSQKFHNKVYITSC